MKLILRLCLFMLVFNPVNVSKAQNEAGYIWTNVKIGGGGFVTGIITTPSQEDLIYVRTDVGGAYRWNETTQAWIPLLDWNSINQTSYQGVESLAIDPLSPNKVYMLAGTDYWNNGLTAILKSDDYGDSFSIVNVTSQFKAHGNGMGRQTGERLAVDPNKGEILFCGTRVNGLFKSEDSGDTWSKVNSFPATPTGSITNVNGIGSVVFDPTSGSEEEPTQRIFATISRTGQDNLYVSEDGGETWEPLQGAINNLMVHRMIYAHGFLYLTYVNETGPWNIGQNAGAVYKYDIAEQVWHNITPAANIPYAGITVDHNNPDIIMVSTINIWNAQNWIAGNTQWGDRIYRSTNGGQNWTSLFGVNKFTLDVSNIWDTGMSLHWVGDIKIDPFNSDRVFAISGNGVFMTKNISNVETGNATWHLQSDNLEETVPMGIISIPGGPAISVIYDYDGFVHKNVYQPNIRHKPSIGNTTGIDFAQNNSDFIVRSGGNDASAAIYYSLNQGNTWTAFATKPESQARSGQVAVSADGDKVIWKPEGVNNILFTSDRGTTWHPVAAQSVTGRPVSDRVNNNIFYTYGGSSLRIFTFNQEANRYDFETVSIGVTGRDLIRPVPHIEGEIWIANNDNGLRVFRKSDKSVTKLQSITACRAVGFGKAPAGKTFPAVYIWGTVDGTEGIFRSDDEGESWLRINDDKHQYGGPGNAHFISGDANVFGRVYMSTVGRGIVMGYPENETSANDPLKIFRNTSGRGITFSNTMTITSESSSVVYRIVNMAGTVIDQGYFSGSKEIGGDLKEGFYILSIHSDKENEIVRILKRN